MLDHDVQIVRDAVADAKLSSRLVAYLPDIKDLSMLTRDSAIADSAKPKNERL